jgi:TIR domain
MIGWKDICGGVWSSWEDCIVGDGGGIGKHLAAYVLRTRSGTFLNGTVTVDFQLGSTDGLYGFGIVFRANDAWTFMSAHVSNVSHGGDSMLQVGCYREGNYTPIASCRDPLPMSDELVTMEVAFISGDIQARVLGKNGLDYALRCVAPHVPFRGYCGLLKLYGCSLRATDFKIQRGVVSPMTDSYDIFLSHSSKDVEVVRDVVVRMKEAGLKVWVDHEQLYYGDSITEKIEDGLSRSRRVVVCLSRNLKSSNWCRKEYGALLHRECSGKAKRRVIPLRLDDCPDDEIPVLLYDKKWADYGDDREFGDLLQFLRS